MRARFSAPVHTPPVIRYLVLFPVVKGLGRGLTTHSHIALRLKKEQNYTSTLPLVLHVVF